MLRGEPLYEKSTASSDGTDLSTFARPDFPRKAVYIDKIAVSMNQEQHFALFRTYFQTLTGIQVKIGDKHTCGSSLQAAVILNPPILWDKGDSLKAFIMINSGTVTIVEKIVYWSYEK